MSVAAENKLIDIVSPHEQMDFSGREQYFRVGKSALECIHDGLRAAGKRTTDAAAPYGVKTILDLPCGQGRVLRYLRFAFPNAEITACDTSREGVDFCAETFDAVPVYSCDAPEEIPIRRDYYDLVFVGSLFTHLQPDMWDRFLRAFHAAMKPGGVLVFTTHGQRAYSHMATKAFLYGHDEAGIESLVRDYDREGFGYVHYTGIDSYYGTSLSRADWVLERTARVSGLRLIQNIDHAWEHHHDVFTYIRES